MATGFDYMDLGLQSGLPEDLARYVPRFIQIESGGDPNAVTGSYRGLLQMGPEEERRYGGIGLHQGVKMYADNYNWFKQTYGREPSPSELYLVAQQGRGGTSMHLANPDQPAWMNMFSTAEGRQKGEAWAKQAIWGNVPDNIKKQFPGGVDTLTSRQFAEIWKNKVENANTPYSASAPETSMGPGQVTPAPNYDPIKRFLDSERTAVFQPTPLSGTKEMLQPFASSFKTGLGKKMLAQYLDDSGLKTGF